MTTTMHVIMYISLYINKTNDNIVTRGRREELELFCHYKVLAPPVQWHSDI